MIITVETTPEDVNMKWKKISSPNIHIDFDNITEAHSHPEDDNKEMEAYVWLLVKQNSEKE